MKYSLKKKARIFKVGTNNHIEIKDVGEIYLDPDEQITFVTRDGKRHDFVSKTWGFYVTPSINVRLKKEGFKTNMSEWIVALRFFLSKYNSSNNFSPGRNPDITISISYR